MVVGDYFRVRNFPERPWNGVVFCHFSGVSETNCRGRNQGPRDQNYFEICDHAMRSVSNTPDAENAVVKHLFVSQTVTKAGQLSCPSHKPNSGHRRFCTSPPLVSPCPPRVRGGTAQRLVPMRRNCCGNCGGPDAPTFTHARTQISGHCCNNTQGSATRGPFAEHIPLWTGAPDDRAYRYTQTPRGCSASATPKLSLSPGVLERVRTSQLAVFRTASKESEGAS